MVEPVLEAGLLIPHSALSNTPTGFEADKPGCAIENRLGGVFVTFSLRGVGVGGGGRGFWKLGKLVART